MLDYYSGTRINGGGQAFVEHFRLDADGKVNETQYQLVSREEPHPPGQSEPEAEQDNWRDRGWDNRGSAAEQGWGAWGWGCRDAQPPPEQRWGASGWERRNTEPNAEQRWGASGWERRNTDPYAEQRWGTGDWGRRDNPIIRHKASNHCSRHHRTPAIVDRLRRTGPIPMIAATVRDKPQIVCRMGRST